MTNDQVGQRETTGFVCVCVSAYLPRRDLLSI